MARLVEEGRRIYEAETKELPNLHFDRHLYQPLLVESGERIRSEPPGLHESERRFVEDLRVYYRAERDGALAGKEIFLLRNLSRGKGIGFFAQRGFYPDFILWIKDGGRQRIVFLEPHGMLHAGPYRHDEKARLHEHLPELEEELAARCGKKDIALDSFIVSATPYEQLRRRYDDGTWNRERFAAAHILFPERNAGYDYIAVILAGGNRKATEIPSNPSFS